MRNSKQTFKDDPPNSAFRYRRKWRGVRAALSVVVAAGTLGALMLPAVTMNQDCELEEHRHTSECFLPGPARIICTSESLGVHVHDAETCYDEEGSLLCGMADYVIHTHEAICYDENGALICTLPEVEAHEHTEECYELPVADPGHVHGSECYAWTPGEALLCTLEEVEGHAHGEGCYGWSLGETPICQQEESQGHAHEEACYDAEGNVICALEESAGHAHDQSCYEKIQGELICTLEEIAGHTHTDACHEQIQGDLICLEEEREPTLGEPALICEKPVVVYHLHTEECYAYPEEPEETDETGEATEPTEATEETVSEEETQPAEKILICGQTVVDAHQHTDECVQVSQVCQLEEHQHVNDCFPNREPETEAPADWEAALPAVTGDWSRDLANAAMSQLGYSESDTNRIWDENGVLRGYTRYGDWVENPYAPWQTTFLSFCLHYANIPQDAVPCTASLTDWMEELSAAKLLYKNVPEVPLEAPSGASAEEPAPEEPVTEEPIVEEPVTEEPITEEPAPEEVPAAPAPRTSTPLSGGDLVFLDMDGDGAADTAAIVVALADAAGETGLSVVLGDYEDAVTLLPYDPAALTAYVSMTDARASYMALHPELKPNVRTHRGEDYTVTARYGDSAGFPQDVTMSVRELMPETEEYVTHLMQIQDSNLVSDIYAVRFFDVTFLDAQGQELEPAAPVDIQILYDSAMAPSSKDCAVIHFDGNGMEAVEALPVVAAEGVTGINFSQDSFSVSAVVFSDRSVPTVGSSYVGRSGSDTVDTSLIVYDASSSTYRRTADDVTANNWQNSFFVDADKISTQKAGGLFMNKSVTTGSVSYSRDGVGERISAKTGEFLVGLSAIGSTQEIAGVESAAVDVMFILDMSSSMYTRNEFRQPGGVADMLNATNMAIERLNGLNPYNRVGVSIYYGRGDLAQSDDSYAETLLPLGRYSKGGTSDYLIYTTTNGGELSTVQVGSNILKDGAAAPVVSHPTPDTAGTFAQLGILHAMDQFMAKTTETVTPEGDPRRPVFIFMTDGLPTAATPVFYQQSDAIMGSNWNDGRSAAQTDFCTQLTAAYAKEQVRQKYNADNREDLEPLFYTLGLSVNNGAISYHVLDPANIGTYAANDATIQAEANTIAGYWDTLVSYDSVTFDYQICAGTWNHNLVTRSATASKHNGFPSSTDQRYYVDKFYYITQTADMLDAFTQIVLEISLQQEFQVTMTEGSANSSGYVTFIDTIGEYMSVKSVGGIILGGEMYDGDQLARNFRRGADGAPDGSNQLGDINEADPDALGTQFVMALGTELGLNPTFTKPENPDDKWGNEGYQMALRIIDAAYNVGQLYYNNEEDYSNAIEWFAGVNSTTGDHTFLGLAHEAGAACGYDCREKHPDADPDISASVMPWHYSYDDPPAGATHLIRSYQFLTPVTQSDGSPISTNAMYFRVWVRTRLSDGQESLIFALPSALLPTVNYRVDLDINKEIYDLSVSGASSPAMLLYKVALDANVDMNAVIENARATYKATGSLSGTYSGIQWLRKDGQLVLDEDGMPVADYVYFYSNDFDPDNQYALNNTHSYFTPNASNDRYYYTGPVDEPDGSPTPIYTKEGDKYVRLRTAPDPNNTDPEAYVEKFVYFTNFKTNEDGSTTKLDKPMAVEEYRPIAQHALRVAAIDADGFYNIPAGTPHDMQNDTIKGMVSNKATNSSGEVATGTAKWSEAPFVNTNEKTSGQYIIGTMQGNNGRLLIDPFNLSGTKSIDLLTDLSDYEFQFELHQTDAAFTLAFAQTGENGDTTIVGTDGNPLPPETKASLIQTVTNSGRNNAEIVFDPLWLTQPGMYYFVVREVPVDGFECDITQYRITVSVGQNQATRILHVDAWNPEKNTSVTVFDNTGEDNKNNAVLEFDQLNFENQLGIELPATGGAGSNSYILCGFAIMAAAAVIYIPLRKKERGVRV